MLQIKKLSELRLATELSLDRLLTDAEELALHELIYGSGKAEAVPTFSTAQDAAFARLALLRG